MIQPRILKGFRDLLPETAIPREAMLEQIRRVFALFAYVPIETPALEYSEILLGKGSEETDKQLYRFRDQGDRDIALRFDLTVPLARFSAMHAAQLGTPFRRYHIAPVWRAEKPQRGRFREFTQCDFDIIGSSSLCSDAEILQLIDAIFRALSIPVRIRVNHRELLGGILAACGAAGKETTVLRAIDKLEKLGKEVVTEELQREASLSSDSINSLFETLSLSTAQEPAATLAALRPRLDGHRAGLQGLERLEQLFDALTRADAASQLSLDLSIARGLDYYTGMVFETQSVDLPDIGSICSGGRYDNLTGLYSKQVLPGVGGSVGLDRTLAALEELGKLSGRSTTAIALIARLDEQCDGERMALAQELRSAGVSVELFPDKAKLGAQFKFADRKGIPLAILAGEAEIHSGQIAVKHLDSGEQETIARPALAQHLLTRSTQREAK